MECRSIYEDIALRTDSNIYIGVVGPVRTGKSTFIKRFMETLVIPNIENVYIRERARDELPQSGSGRTIMTAEPKFVPEDAVQISVENGASLAVRLIDCVGYMVDGALGQYEGEAERMVTTPWFENEITITQAAEIGTQKVISEHSTIGIVVTTDGSICDLPREAYVQAEERVVHELKELKKPFIVLVNSTDPSNAETQQLCKALREKYDTSCIAVNCQALEEPDITNIIKTVLFEFPISEFGVFLPPWVDVLPVQHEIKKDIFDAIRTSTAKMFCIKDVQGVIQALGEIESVKTAEVKEINLGTGCVLVNLELPRELFYKTLSAQSGFVIADDGDLVSLLTELSVVKSEYDKISDALNSVKQNGYGIVLPSNEELKLEKPEIVKQGSRYGVRLKASAPSIHMFMANVETEVSPAVGGGRSSEDIINFLLQEFEGDVSKIWESNIFGKSLYDIASESVNAKIKKLPEDAQVKLRETLQRIINEGNGGLICIIL